MAGAPTGNQNARKAKIWQQAIKRALARKVNSTVDAGLDSLADKLVEAGLNGDQWALIEIGNRMDGRPAQEVDIAAEIDATVRNGLGPVYGIQPPAEA